MATTDEGVVTPPLSNAPNVPADMQAMATSLTKKVIPQFASSAARVITAPTDGQMTYQQDTRRLERYWAASSTYSQFLGMNTTMRRAAVQSIATGTTPVAVSWDTTVLNPANLTVSPSGVTVPAAGWYRVRFAGEFPAQTGNPASFRVATILQNGAEVTSVNRFTVPAQSGTFATGLVLPGMKILCAAGDVITIGVIQNTGSALNLSGNATMEIELAQ